MDITALSMSLSQMKVANQASISVLKLTMDTAQEQMEDMTKIMEQSVNPHIGSNLDLKLLKDPLGSFFVILIFLL